MKNYGYLSFLLSGAALLTACSATASGGEAAIRTASARSVQEIHESSIIIDAHADIMMPNTSADNRDADGLSQVTPEKLRAGGVDTVAMTLAITAGASRSLEADAEGRAEVNTKLAAVRALVESAPDKLVFVKSADDIVAADKAGKTGILLSFQNARSLEKNIDALDEFYDLGVRIFALNHMSHNDFSDSSRPVQFKPLGIFDPQEEHGGLSELGRAAIRRINALGGVVDVTQMSKNATLQAVSLSTAPVIASHSNARALSNVPRNLSDEEIDAIGAKGGVVHIVAYPDYLRRLDDPDLAPKVRAVRRVAGLSETYAYAYEFYWEIEDPQAKADFLKKLGELLVSTTTVEHMVDHIDYIVRRIGIDHVGVGNDFNHGGGLSDYRNASQAKNLTAALIRRGYSAKDIRKIWGGNFLRVMREADAQKARKTTQP